MAETMDYNELPGNSVSNDSIEDSSCEQLPSTSIDSGEESVKHKINLIPV